MSAGKLQYISQELRAPAPQGLDVLSDNELQAIASALQAARKKQQQQLAAATAASLQHVPLLLRGAVKKVLGIK